MPYPSTCWHWFDIQVVAWCPTKVPQANKSRVCCISGKCRECRIWFLLHCACWLSKIIYSKTEIHSFIHRVSNENQSFSRISTFRHLYIWPSKIGPNELQQHIISRFYASKFLFLFLQRMIFSLVLYNIFVLPYINIILTLYILRFAYNYFLSCVDFGFTEFDFADYLSFSKYIIQSILSYRIFLHWNHVQVRASFRPGWLYGSAFELAVRFQSHSFLGSRRRW